MTLEDFGRALLKTGDLDPVYTILHQSNMDRDQLRRWCLAYWCCYHAGAASWLSEHTGDWFWAEMEMMARNETLTPIGTRWPRGHERRHFRGAKAVNAVRHLAWRYDGKNGGQGPENAAQSVEALAPSFTAIRDYVMSWPQFGPWIAFKVADMVDRVLGSRVDFSEADVFVFDTPLEGAVTWYNETHLMDFPKDISSGQKIHAATVWLEVNLNEFKAPPFNDRPLNLQEFETILCKWKSHLNGHYPIGNDIHEISNGLKEWGVKSETAHNLEIHAFKLRAAL